MGQKWKSRIAYIGLFCVWAVLFCGCSNRQEQEMPVTEVSGLPEEVILTEMPNAPTGTPIPSPSLAPSATEITESTPVPSPSSTPTLTVMPTSTPTPVITNPYDGRFWIGKYAEDTALLLTQEQIKEQNDKNYRATGTKLVVLSERKAYTAGEVLGMIEEYRLPARKYFDNKEFGTAEKEALLQERSLSALRDNAAREIVPECGILTSNTDVRSFPTAKRLTSEVQGRFDYLQETRLLIGEAVLVLHRSEDGMWCFVQAENYCGWIRESAIAYCTRDELCTVTETMADVENGKIAVVTKSGMYRIGEEDIYLRMGTRFLCDDIERHDKTTNQLINVQTEETVTINLPRRGADGLIVWEEANVSTVDAEGECCIVTGYLPYTRANIMRLAVRLLGAPYAWGDAPSFGAEVSKAGDDGMDCSSTVAAVFRCFGFVLPRNTGTQRKMDCTKQELSALGTGQRREALDRMQGGELLYTSGHVMLYLGTADGEYYVLHNTSTEARDDGGKDEFYRCVITTMGLGKKGQTILERLIQRNTLFPID